MTGGPDLRLSWSTHAGYECLRVRGWTGTHLDDLRRLNGTELGRRLAVLPAEFIPAGAASRAMQGTAGRFMVEDDSVVFVPRFPFLDGRSYALLVESDSAAGADGVPAVWTLHRPASADTPATEVVAIYPSAGMAPVNLLKLYVRFSEPMSEGQAMRAVRVRRADTGERLEGVFLNMEPELWDRERLRLTLLLDPGRIKRGLVSNAEAGYPLIEGVPVVISINREFRDAVGRPLRAGAERRYTVGAAVRTRVDPARWRYVWPRAGSREPLTVTFDRPLDHALLHHCLWIEDAGGEPVDGPSEVGPGEQSWRFEPAAPWGGGSYAVCADPRLEDLAGNSLIRVFDRDLTDAADTPVPGRSIAIDFTCIAPVGI